MKRAIISLVLHILCVIAFTTLAVIMPDMMPRVVYAICSDLWAACIGLDIATIACYGGE